MSQPSSSCWSGLERKLFWFRENKDFFKKFRLNNIPHQRPPPPPTESQPGIVTETSTRPRSEAANVEEGGGNVEEDLLNIKALLVKLKSVLSQVRAEDEGCESSSLVSSVARENELLKKELKLLKLMVRERDTKIKNLENLINFENNQYCNSFTDWSIN